MNPFVTIILPTYKNAPLLDRAIQSVVSQTFQTWELLIIDDGLTLETQSKLGNFATDQRIKVIKNEQNRGIQRSLNRGLAEARGIYIARIDDDDVWSDVQKLQKQVSYFTEHPQLVLLGTNAAIVDQNNKLLGTYHMPQSDMDVRKRILSKNCFLHPTVMMRTDAVRMVGGYPEGERTLHIEDYALWLQLGTKGVIANLPDLTTALTIHADSLTAKHRLLQASRMRSIIKTYKNVYPGYLLGYFVLTLRLFGFWFINTIPIPKRVLYFIQRMYKSF